MSSFTVINRLKQTLDSHRPLPREVAANVHENILLRWTYNSNAIEGNTLTLNETKAALEGAVVKGKSLKEHFEAVNHKKAIEAVETLVEHNENLSERRIRSIHGLVLKGVDDKNAGIYRKTNVVISGAQHIPPDAVHVREQMEAFISWYQGAGLSLHPVERAARIHSEFVKIHPFVDGNGRTSRLLMNWELMRNGFPPAILPMESRSDYYQALDNAHVNNDYAAFMRLMVELVEDSFDPYWRALKVDKKTILATRPPDETIPPSSPPPPELPDTKEKLASQIPAAQLLIALGYEYLTPEQASRERLGKNSNVLLEGILHEQLQKLNRIRYKGREYSFSESNIQSAIQQLKSVRYDGLQRTNESVYNNMLAQGVALPQTIDGDSKSFLLQFIDWQNHKNNRFHVSLEYAVEREWSTKIAVPDMVLFINGIPFAVIECKSPKVEVNEAISQMIRNQGNDYIPRLFIYTQLVMAINTNKAKYATAGTSKDFWSVWQEKALTDESSDDFQALSKNVQESLRHQINPEDLSLLPQGSLSLPDLGKTRSMTEQDKALYALCRPERLLDLAGRFTVFDGGIKKIARYQQYFVIKSMLQRIMEHVDDSSRWGGIVFHTQGSGKSLTMVMLARNLILAPGLENPRIVLVSDRQDLDKQIGEVFRNSDLAVKRALSGKNLLDLVSHQQADIITTLVHKFKKAHGVKKFQDESRNIFVLVDESHRTQFGEFAGQMRSMFPNACYFGFTGTPLMKKEKNSFARFGEMIRPSYSINQAVKDGAVVPLLYEGRHSEMRQNKKAMDFWFERHTADLSEAQKADLKRKYARADELNKADRVVYMRAFDINEDYKSHWQGTGLKAQLAAPDKATALKYHKYLKEFGGVSSEVIISPPDMREGYEEVEDESKNEVVKFWKKMLERYGNESEYNERIINQFKHGDHPEIIIVVDKLLTGFDAPCNTVLYLCRKLKEHTLLQAIGRVNRLHKDKEFGHIIDYVGTLGELDRTMTTYGALEGFDEEDVAGTMLSIDDEIKKLLQRHSNLWGIFRAVKNSSDLETYERLLGDEKLREEFYQCLEEYTKTLRIALSSEKFLMMTDDNDLKRYKNDLCQFQSLRKSVKVRYAEEIDYQEYGAKIRQLLDTHIESYEIIRLNEPVNIHDQKDFDEAKENMGMYKQKREISTASQADQIAHRMKKYINENLEKDPAFYGKFSKLVKATIDDFRAGRISDSKYLDKAREIQKAVNEKKYEGVPANLVGNGDAIAYYGVLQSLLRERKLADALDDESAQSIATEMALAIYKAFQKHEKVDFWNDKDAQNLVMNEIDDCLLNELRDKKGIHLSTNQMDEMIEGVMRVARNRGHGQTRW